jgi:hypothetical protein
MKKAFVENIFDVREDIKSRRKKAHNIIFFSTFILLLPLLLELG